MPILLLAAPTEKPGRVLDANTVTRLDSRSVTAETT